MIEFGAHLAFACLWCFGFRVLFTHDHLLYSVYEWAEKTFGDFWIKPFIGCVICFASFHGTIWFFLFMYPEFDWYYWPLFCVCLCGLNTIVDNATS
jgi:hypothetical protein